MKDFNQQIIKFNYEQNFNNDDFFVSKSNEHVFKLLNRLAKMGKKFFKYKR